MLTPLSRAVVQMPSPSPAAPLAVPAVRPRGSALRGCLIATIAYAAFAIGASNLPLAYWNGTQTLTDAPAAVATANTTALAVDALEGRESANTMAATQAVVLVFGGLSVTTIDYVFTRDPKLFESIKHVRTYVPAAIMSVHLLTMKVLEALYDTEKEAGGVLATVLFAMLTVGSAVVGWGTSSAKPTPPHAVAAKAAAARSPGPGGMSDASYDSEYTYSSA
jgi:hypothetical protein